MSKLGLVIVLILLTGRSIAQRYPASSDGSSNPEKGTAHYFVLIQADDNQAFYIRVDSELYSSSPRGHLILAPLKDSTYKITLGFPGQLFPEQQFQLAVHKKDIALRLRRREGGWAFYDVQGQSLSPNADPVSDEKRLPAGIKKDDAFSQMMAAIVRDTAVMYSTFAADSVDSVATVTPARATAVSPDSVASPLGTPPSAPTGVVKLSEHKSSKALFLVYADHPDSNVIDTVDVLIPADSPAAAPARHVSDSAHSAVIRSSATQKSILPFVNSDCHAFATDFDVDRLRVKMLDAAKDEDRVTIAHKVFKIKCFSTKQLRELSKVFASEPGKFRFLEMAYPFVSDEHFADLGNVLTDPVYAAKFRTMTERH